MQGGGAAVQGAGVQGAGVQCALAGGTSLLLFEWRSLMDRSDELKERPAEDARDTGEGIKRDGDVLGLGGSPVPESADAPTTEYDPASVRQR